MTKKAPSRSTSKAKKARAQQERGIVIGGILVAVIAFVLLIFLLVNQLKTGTAASVSPGKYSDIPQTTTALGAPVLGSPDTKIMIMEFADFSCPHCLEYHDTILQMIDNYVRPGKVRFVYEPEIFVGGQYSNVAAQAALCAGKQGRFWEMHDALFQLQATRGAQGFDPDTMQATADSLGINGTEVKACIARGEMDKVVQQSYDLGQGYGVNGTPAVMISTDGKTFHWLTGPNGEQMNKGGVPYSLIAANIDQASQQ